MVPPRLKKRAGLSSLEHTHPAKSSAFAPLLEAVIHNLGPPPAGTLSAREVLLDNLSSNLALGTRESTPHIQPNSASSVEIANQAEKIGKTLVQYARDVETESVEYDPEFVIRSLCEGHLLKPEVAYLMFGPRSLGHLMQIYNEYLHQMVLFRDSLLPFENFEQVVISIEASLKRGMRFMEDSRGQFLMVALTKSITQDSVFNFAKTLLAKNLEIDNAYGFQYEHGLILPTFVGGGNRDELPPSPSGSKADEVAELVLSTPEKGIRQLQFSLQYKDGSFVSVDLGQIARGRRYAYGLNPTENGSTVPQNYPIHIYSTREILKQSAPGLITAKNGIHLIQASSKLELPGLLGKLYPENVVKGESIEVALKIQGKLER